MKVTEEFKIIVKEEADFLRDIYFKEGITPSLEEWEVLMEKAVLMALRIKGLYNE